MPGSPDIQINATERIGGNARMAQGQQNVALTHDGEGGGSGSASRRRGRSRDPSPAPCAARDLSDTPRQSSSLNDLERKLVELQEKAITWKTGSRETTTGSGGSSRSGVRHHTDEVQHYKDHTAERGGFESGEVYRLWHDTNVVVHQSTFLILSVNGTSMTCLKLVHCDPKDANDKFRRNHGRIVAQARAKDGGSTSTQAQYGPYKLDIDEDQEITDHCWINIRDPWNNNWLDGYKYAFCGSIVERSFQKIKGDYISVQRRTLQLTAN